MPVNRFCWSYGPGHLMHWIRSKTSHTHGHPSLCSWQAGAQDRAAMTDVYGPIGDGLHYYVLPKYGDPVAALNILREAAGLGPWPEDEPT
jgi:hypothetical protein